MSVSRTPPHPPALSPAARAALAAVTAAAEPVLASLGGRASGLAEALAALQPSPDAPAGPPTRVALQAAMAELQRTTAGPATREAIATLREALMEAGAALSRPAVPPGPRRPSPARLVVRRPLTSRRPTAWGRLASLLAHLPPLLSCTSPTQLACTAGLGLLARSR
ncbi:MAG: hypothetical protein VKQ33_00160 [Candidatus Sericytochromatia bacterium]|nr:hypothetical protein [Candidatus Sericytochromatia bacterium]